MRLARMTQASPPRKAIDTSDTVEKVIGPCHLVRRIEEGGTGEVWLAKQKEPSRLLGRPGAELRMKEYLHWQILPMLPTIAGEPLEYPSTP
jgi:hypothetical protein